ncbi:restriction endonuclease [Flavobacterium denitrificans]|uniref:nSTAND3 domain-containing NTPase n=1 Tax=Flavobacterium denitrificans TaxID=281361 RepID=UPI0003FD1093|nr:restriction endonuclease [Flavobacterium denitrificans]
MNEYNFSTLNDKDFEILVKDLLNAEFDLKLQHFKNGKDKGIDLRYSKPTINNSIVVQVKHYIGSTYSQLKSKVKNDEFSKIKKLDPERYIIVTSLSLSALQKDELKNLLNPYIKTSNDIIGKEDLNGYLQKNPQIERNHFKLWFSSTTVLSSILNNAIESRSRYLLQQLQNNVKFYVVTEKLAEANEILLKEKLLLITGQPGIGKTTLAELLILERAFDNFQIYQVENITEAEQVIINEEDKPQLFYFDDFLGANYNEIVNAHKTETQLTRFVEQVRNTPNKYIVLTTRTVILNQAIQKYEKISRSSLSSNQFELKLNDYSKYEKALILYNHIYFRELHTDLFEKILQDKFYDKIISHRNYIPRLINFITDKNQTKHILPQNYREFIWLNLKNPKEIWRSSFNNQISYFDQCLLLTLFTFEKNAEETNLFDAFQERLKYERTEHNQIISTNQFNDSIKTLLNGFIVSNFYINQSVREYSFINPSLIDFLLPYVSESESEKKAIISSAKYIEQLRRFNPFKGLIKISKEIELIIRDRIDNNQISILESNYLDNNKKNSLYAETLCRYCPSINKDSALLKYFSAISMEKGWFPIINNVSFIFHNLGNSPKTIEFIKNNFKKIIHRFISATDDIETVKEIPEIFEIFNQDYDAFTESEEGLEVLLELVNVILSNTEESIKSDYKDQVKSLEDVELYREEFYTIESELSSILFPNSYIDFGYTFENDEDYWNIHIQNNTRDDYSYDDYKSYKESMYRPSYDKTSDLRSEENKIDDLFSE